LDDDKERYPTLRRDKGSLQHDRRHKSKRPGVVLPSIEKKYGQPISHWLDLLGTVSGKKHMEMVAWLKDEHGMGHGHANALVAHYLASAKT